MQAEVAKQRVRIAKNELKRARKRLKEAKREAKRARKQAVLARKAWKKARRRADMDATSPDRQPIQVQLKQGPERRVRKPGAAVAGKPTRRAGSSRVTRRKTAPGTRRKPRKPVDSARAGARAIQAPLPLSRTEH